MSASRYGWTSTPRIDGEEKADGEEGSPFWTTAVSDDEEGESEGEIGEVEEEEGA